MNMAREPYYSNYTSHFYKGKERQQATEPPLRDTRIHIQTQRQFVLIC